MPVVLVVHPSTRRRKASPELIALAKSKPGQLNYASSGVATTPHLAGALLNVRAGIKLVHVPYQGSSPAVTDLLAGRTQIMFSAVSVVLPHIQAGTLKALAWAAPKRGAVLPDLPTVAEVGMPELDASIWFGLMAPAGTPKDIVRTRSRGRSTRAQVGALRGQFKKMGYEPLGGTPAGVHALRRQRAAQMEPSRPPRGRAAFANTWSRGWRKRLCVTPSCW